MSTYLPILLQTTLFAGFSRSELEAFLPTLSPAVQQYQKGETLLLAGYETTRIGIVLGGKVEATKETRTGGEFTVSHIKTGGIFGDVLSGGHNKSPVTLTALTNCRVMYIAYPKLLQISSGNNALHRRLLANLVSVISDKYFALDRRVDLLLVRGLRRRISTYLLDIYAQKGASFSIPYTRTALAAYLGCERSALSREISRMAQDGLLHTDSQYFELLDVDELKRLVAA